MLFVVIDNLKRSEWPLQTPNVALSKQVDNIARFAIAEHVQINEIAYLLVAAAVVKTDEARVDADSKDHPLRIKGNKRAACHRHYSLALSKQVLCLASGRTKVPKTDRVVGGCRQELLIQRGCLQCNDSLLVSSKIPQICLLLQGQQPKRIVALVRRIDDLSRSVHCEACQGSPILFARYRLCVFPDNRVV